MDGIPLPEDVRLARLAKGEAAMVNHLKAAQFAYDNIYDLPDYPPDVKFTPGVNSDAEITLTWSDDIESSVHPDFAEADVAMGEAFVAMNGGIDAAFYNPGVLGFIDGGTYFDAPLRLSLSGSF